MSYRNKQTCVRAHNGHERRISSRQSAVVTAQGPRVFVGGYLRAGSLGWLTKGKEIVFSDYLRKYLQRMNPQRTPLATKAKGKDKIVNFIDMLTEHYRKIYSPDIDLSLDESLMLFRGRLVFRQYIKSKEARYGIKFYELTTADGYVLNIYMYCGKEDASKIDKTVFRLFRPFLYKGHNLYMDNYYNSVTLSIIELLN